MTDHQQETNGDAREVVESYFADVMAGRFAEAAARMAPDATLWLPGEGRWPLGGKHDVQSLKEIHKIIRDRFPNGLQLTVKGVIGEGERVAAEVESYGVRRDGRIYNNQYHYLIIVRDGLIQHRCEYLDTMHANDLLCGPIEGTS